MVNPRDIEFVIKNPYFETEQERLAYLYALAEGYAGKDVREATALCLKTIKDLFQGK